MCHEVAENRELQKPTIARGDTMSWHTSPQFLEPPCSRLGENKVGVSKGGFFQGIELIDSSSHFFSNGPEY